MISGSNEQLQQELEHTLLKPDCHSLWISKMQSRREDTLEERYAIKLCFKLGKNATERYIVLTSNSYIWPIDRTLSDATTPCSCGPGSDDNERYSAFPKAPALPEPHYQINMISRTFIGVVFPLCRDQSVYSATPANWTM